MAETFHTLKVVDAWDETRTLRAIVVEAAALRASDPGQLVKVKNEKGEGYFALANAPGSGKLESPGATRRRRRGRADRARATRQRGAGHGPVRPRLSRR